MKRGPATIFILPAVLLAVACGGSAPSDLFNQPLSSDPGDTTVEPVREEGDEDEPSPSPEDEDDATTPRSAKDGGVATDASTDATSPDASRPDASSDGGSGRCFEDTECPTKICNWKTDRCASVGPLEAPCKRDLECTGKLCNWKLEKCAVQAPKGTPCLRNKECTSNACNAVSGTCD